MSAAAKRIIKRAINLALDDRYHRHNARRAKRILKCIEEKLGKTPSADIRQCDQYAAEVLGHSRFAPWLYVYSAVAGGFKEGWIPPNFYAAMVVPVINGQHGRIAGLKSLNATLFKNDLFPDIASFVNGLFLDSRDGSLIRPKDLEALLFRDVDRIVFKLDDSIQGEGIYAFTKDEFSVGRIRSLGNGVFQEFIEQHGDFQQIFPHSVATLRVTSVVEDSGDISLRACYLRLGSGTDRYVQSQSHVRIPIALDSGAFSDKGYLPTWLTTSFHPTSGVPFHGRYVPCFHDCLSTVVELHRAVPYARCVGWDITVDAQEKVKVMEWNARHNDIKFSEATQGPCFRGLDWESLPQRTQVGLSA